MANLCMAINGVAFQLWVMTAVPRKRDLEHNNHTNAGKSCGIICKGNLMEMAFLLLLMKHV